MIKNLLAISTLFLTLIASAKTADGSLTAEMVEGHSYAAPVWLYLPSNTGAQKMLTMTDFKFEADGNCTFSIGSVVSVNLNWSIKNDTLAVNDKNHKISFVGTSPDGGLSLMGSTNFFSVTNSATLTQCDENNVEVNFNNLVAELVAGEYNAFMGASANGATSCYPVFYTFEPNSNDSGNASGAFNVRPGKDGEAISEGTYGIVDGKLVFTTENGKIDCTIKGNGKYIEAKFSSTDIEGVGNVGLFLLFLKKP